MSCPFTASGTDAIVRWLSESLDSVSHEPAAFEVLHAQENASSTHWLIRIRSSAQPERLFVKRHRSSILYEQERDALSLLAGYSSEPEPFAVPELKASNDSLGCIALKWIDGESIGATIRRSVSRFASSADLDKGRATARRVGKWLLHLNRRTAQGRQELPHDELTTRFEELVRIGGRHGRISTGDQGLLINRFHETLQQCEPESYCLVHKDFWFDHIWISGNQMIVLDFGRAHFGPRGRDVNQFYCRLGDMAASNPLVSKDAAQSLQNSYLEGYGVHDPNSSNNRMWQMLTRAEQLAGLAEVRMGFKPARLVHASRIHTLGRQLLSMAEA